MMDLEAFVVLGHSARGIGAAALRALLQGLAVHHLSPAELQRMQADEVRRKFGLTGAQTRSLLAVLSQPLSSVGDTLTRLHRMDAALITLLDAAYPARLARTMTAPPPALYCKGDHDLIGRPLIAVANSNQTPRVAAEQAEAVVSLALDAGYVVVTGHNRLEYQQPALVAARQQAPVCYVLDRGLLSALEGHDGSAPFAAARVWPTGRPRGDLFVSALPPLSSGVPGGNRLRDELIASLATAIVATCVRPGGTMESVITRAVESGTPFAWIGAREQMPEHLRSVRNEVFPDASDKRLAAWLRRVSST